MNKNNYVIHYRNLQQCLKLGMKLKKTHRILKFKQKDWMKLYIDVNTERTKEATNEADKNRFKLLNNAVYGKTMKNMRKRVKIRILKIVKTLLNIHQDLHVLIGKYLKTIQLQFVKRKSTFNLKQTHISRIYSMRIK